MTNKIFLDGVLIDFRTIYEIHSLPRLQDHQPSLSHGYFSISHDLLFGPVIKLALFSWQIQTSIKRPHGYARSSTGRRVCMKSHY